MEILANNRLSNFIPDKAGRGFRTMREALYVRIKNGFISARCTLFVECAGKEVIGDWSE